MNSGARTFRPFDITGPPLYTILVELVSGWLLFTLAGQTWALRLCARQDLQGLIAARMLRCSTQRWKWPLPGFSKGWHHTLMETRQLRRRLLHVKCESTLPVFCVERHGPGQCMAWKTQEEDWCSED